MRVNAFVLLAALLLAPSPLRAQATTGSISGSVADETGAVMPGVTINVKHVDTGLERSTAARQIQLGLKLTF